MPQMTSIQLLGRQNPYLDLAVPPVVDRSPRDVGPVPGVVVGVDLDVEGEALDALLGAEVGAQALHGDVNLKRRKTVKNKGINSTLQSVLG